MTLDLDPIRARLAAATPGPWEVDECSEETTVIVAGSDLTIICSELWQGWEGTQDAALIANAPTDMAALVAEVERLRESVQRVREVHQPRPYADDDLRAVAPSLPEFVCDRCRGKSDSAVPYPCLTIRALDGVE